MDFKVCLVSIVRIFYLFWKELVLVFLFLEVMWSYVSCQQESQGIRLFVVYVKRFFFLDVQKLLLGKGIFFRDEICNRDFDFEMVFCYINFFFKSMQLKQ